VTATSGFTPAGNTMPAIAIESDNQLRNPVPTVEDPP
jgi:hypothetical protein